MINKIKEFFKKVKEFLIQCKLKFELILIKIKMWIEEYFSKGGNEND